uniref:Putative sulfotransferase n=1 Tax=Ixodes ricinus TaxID=34613 RepID=A0A0K8RAT6_IXORI
MNPRIPLHLYISITPVSNQLSASRLLQDNMQESTTEPVEPKLRRFTFITFHAFKLLKSNLCSKAIIVFFLIFVSIILVLKRQPSHNTEATITEDIAPNFVVEVNPEGELHPDTWWDGDVGTFTRQANTEYIVPNIVHFVRIGIRHLSFV